MKSILVFLLFTSTLALAQGQMKNECVCMPIDSGYYKVYYSHPKEHNSQLNHAHHVYGRIYWDGKAIRWDTNEMKHTGYYPCCFREDYKVLCKFYRDGIYLREEKTTAFATKDLTK